MSLDVDPTCSSKSRWSSLALLVQLTLVCTLTQIPEKVSLLGHVTATVGLLSSVIMLVVLLYALNLSEGEAFDYVIEITGATACTFISFLFPGMIYWKLLGHDSFHGKVAVALVILGVAVFISVPVLLFT